ncbi:MAG: hypothetical protein IJ566_01980 [Cardiobacteriaceae bacterium]|nr:hypothetical protein [Cardiobacteriaceae bacterium]
MEKDKKEEQTVRKTVEEKWKPVPINFKTEAGKRILNAAVTRVIERHAEEIKALADK